MLLLSCLGCALPAPYPLGLYSVPSTNDLSTVRDAGFNLVTGPATRAYLDAARARGLRVLAFPHTTAGTNFNPRAARWAVQEFDRHPALWAWYVTDEPELSGISPEQVRQANRFLKNSGARQPTALVLYKGQEALHFAHLTDVVMVDHYPVPWLPLASFGQHVRLARLALGPKKPLIAVVQSFDWSQAPEYMAGEKNLRPPTREELRCLAYSALVQRANGLFFYAYEAGQWRIREHPESWENLKLVAAEVRRLEPLFQAEQVWWPYRHEFKDWDHRFNAALESSIAPALLRVKKGNCQVPPGDYLLAVNTTDHPQTYAITLPPPSQGLVPVVEEQRLVTVKEGWLEDDFAPLAVHIYGPLPQH